MSKIKIFSLGGLNETGKNMYVIDVDDNIFVFDAGLKYPNSKMLGVDYIIPDMSYLIKNKDKIKGLFLSHGHIGNIGAVPDLLKELPNIAVYASKYTMHMLKKDLPNSEKYNLNEIKPHSKLNIAGFTIFPIEITHAIPEALAYVLYTEDGAIVYATDFVFDSTMLGNYKTDIGKLAYVGKQGVLCLLSESSYAYREGFTSPKQRISEDVWDLVNDFDGRIIISAFPSHLYRIQEILDQIAKTKRKIVFMGKQFQEEIKYASENGYLSFNKNKIGDLTNIEDKNVVIMVADSKEKPYASIEKIINGYDKYLKFKEDDKVFISEPVYPGNEKKSAKVLDDLSRFDIEAIIPSFKEKILYHGSREDLMQMINLMNPKYYFPIKGEYRYQVMNANVAEQAGINKDNILLKQNGDLATIEKGKLVKDFTHIPVDSILIDGNKAEDIGELVLKDRELLSKNGIVIVSCSIDRSSKKILADPKILTRGFIYVKDNVEMVNKTGEISKKVIESCLLPGQKVDFTKIKQRVRKDLGDYFYKETGSIPMVITVILEI